MCEQAFPERLPEIVITPQPEGELREVVRRDASDYPLPLELGAEGCWAYYEWPERKLTTAHFGWVAGERTYRRRKCLEVLERSLVGVSGGSWRRLLYKVAQDVIQELFFEDSLYTEGHHTAYFRSSFGSIKEGREGRIFLVGDAWSVVNPGEEEGNDTIWHSVVDGPYRLTISGGAWSCLRHTKWSQDTSEGQMLYETYLLEDGRTILLRQYVDDSWLRFSRYQQLTDSLQREQEGKMYYLCWDRLIDMALAL